MRHPDEGSLRRLLDEAAGVADTDRRHVAGCSQCLGRLAAVREDAALIGAALATDDAGEVDVPAAWRRLATALPEAEPEPVPAPARPGRARGFLRRPVVAALAFALVLTGAGAAAANDWLPIFRTERIAPVSFTTADLVAVPDLTAYGRVAVTGQPAVHEVRDAAAARKQSGLDVPDVSDLPRGVSGQPVYQVGGKVAATFTFSADRAAHAAAKAGKALPPVPPGLDGAKVRLEAGPGVAAVWSQQAGVPALVVGRAVAPTAFSSGVPFDVVRDYLLSLPGLPDKIAEQLRTFSGDGSTLPLPVPADQVITTSTSVNGLQGTLLETRDRTVAAVVWVDDGAVTVVAGPLDGDEVLSVARKLR